MVHTDDTPAVATTGSGAPGPRDRQEPAPVREDQPHPTFRRWSVTIGLGGASRGPAGDLEAAMRAGGFGDPMPSLFGSTEYPRPSSRRLGFPRFIDLECRLREHLGIGALYSHASIRMTMGYHEPFQFLNVNTHVNTVGVTGTLAYRGLRAAIGPAWHVARTTQEEVGRVTRTQSHGRLGLVGQFGLQAPSRSTVYFDARAQYNHVGSATVGPFVSPAFFSEPERICQASAVRFNHWLITVGVGFRF